MQAIVGVKALQDATEPLRAWEQDGFKLELFETDQYDPQPGRMILAYRFTHEGVVIFEGSDYSPSPLHDPASDEAVAGLLDFLSLREGDTDDNYFTDYTADQLAWTAKYGEELAAIVADLEEQSTQDA